VTADGRALPLREVTLAVDAGGGLARAVLAQRFVNPHAEPLRVSYLVPLPVDGALAGYAIRVGERRIVGEVDRIRLARERFETALVEGRSAGLVDQERPNLFTLELGNVPPGAEVVAELTIDQRLAWLDEGAWEWRFPTVVAPRYLGADGRVPDAERVTVDVADAPITARAAVTLRVRDVLPEGRAPLSPSHPITGEPGASGWQGRIDGAALDRDLVVRWRTAGAAAGVALDAARPPEGHARAGTAYGLLTLVPPAPEAGAAALPRDLILLLDTSGSMAGEPLAQARTFARALVQGLGQTDRLERIAFAGAPHRWRRGAEPATAAARADALAWLDGLAAEGSTEMREAVVRALRPLRRDAQRQAVLVTTG
jgi:Ca-activated chloride channel family protein